MNEIEKAIKGQRAAQSQKIYDSFEKSESEGDIEKARGAKAEIGEMRVRPNGKTYQKQADGTWKEVVNEESSIKKLGSLQLEAIFKKTNSAKEKELVRKELSRRVESGSLVYADGKNPFKKAETSDIGESEGYSSEDVEKSDIMSALDSGGNNIKVTKTGKEIKEQIKTVVLPQLNADLEVKKSEADAKLKEVGAAPTKNVDPWWTRDLKLEVGYKIFDWDETYLPSSKSGVAECCSGSLSAEHAEANKVNAPTTQDEANARRAYNDIVRCVCNILVDIKACEIIGGLKDNESYELTARQIISFQF